MCTITYDNNLVQGLSRWFHGHVQTGLAGQTYAVVPISDIREGQSLSSSYLEGEATVHVGDRTAARTVDGHVHTDHRVTILVDNRTANHMVLLGNSNTFGRDQYNLAVIDAVADVRTRKHHAQRLVDVHILCLQADN